VRRPCGDRSVRRNRAQKQAPSSPPGRYTAAIASISRRKLGFASPRRMHSVLPGA
jgi:hypothetical protein